METDEVEKNYGRLEISELRLTEILVNESFLTNDSGFETPSSTPGSGAVKPIQTQSHLVEKHYLDSPVDLDFNDCSCHSILSYVSKLSACIFYAS